jgi:CheY-like chemotaxis protein
MKTLLIADDEPGMRVLVRATVESDQYQVLEAEDGDQAWEVIEREAPDLVLLDVQMPGRNGFEIAEAIRANPRLAKARIIILTGLTQATNQRAGMAAGADHYLTKPFSPFQLLSLIDEALGTD